MAATIAEMTPAQAARVLGLSPDYVRDLVDAGRLRATRTALGRLIDAVDVERLRVERAGQGR